MYALGRRVYVKSIDAVGVISEREWLGKPRHASYLVDLGDSHDYLTHSKDLSPADWQCDGCERWRPEADVGNGPRDIDGYMLVRYCWFCVNVVGESRY